MTTFGDMLEDAPVRKALGCSPSPSSYPWTISVDVKIALEISLHAQRFVPSSRFTKIVCSRQRERSKIDLSREMSWIYFPFIIRARYPSHCRSPSLQRARHRSVRSPIGFVRIHSTRPRARARTLDFFFPPAWALAALAAFDSGAFGGIFLPLRERARAREGFERRARRRLSTTTSSRARARRRGADDSRLTMTPRLSDS